LLNRLFQNINYYWIHQRTRFLSVIVLILSMSLGVFLRWKVLDSALINVWIARDFDRTFSLLLGDYIPLAGPDLSNGGRLPGPFLYFFLLPPLWIQPTYEALFNYNFFLNISSLILVFFISARYFNFYFAFITTAIFSINLSHISSIHFPTNASFLCIFLILFVGFLFEFLIKRNAKILPVLVLILSLGVQLHYQISIYLVILIILALFFKIKIPIRTVLASLIIAFICFLPYSFHKSQTFIPEKSGIEVFDSIESYKIDPFAFVEKTIKIITVQNTISRIFLFYPFDFLARVSEDIRAFNRVGFSIAFFSLLIYVQIRSRKQKTEDFSKEIIVLVLFYIPALIYDLIDPHSKHFWYNYIFDLPKTFIVAMFFFTLYRFFSQRSLRVGLVAGFVFLYGFYALFNYRVTFKYLNHFDKKLETANNVNSNSSGSYKNSKILLNKIMTQLNLTPEEYYERVYFLDFYPSSRRRIDFALSKKSGEHLTKETKPYPCYFILDPFALKPATLSSENSSYLDSFLLSKSRRYNLFLKDPSIKSQNVSKISFFEFGFPKYFLVYEYLPKFKQSCYSNGHNPFMVARSIRDLLRETKEIKNISKKTGVGFKKISAREEYDSKSELVLLKEEYIVYDNVTQTPFRLILSIKRMDKGYSIRTQIDSFYFYSRRNFNFSFFDVLLTPAKANTDENQEEGNRSNKILRISVLTKDTLITADGINITGHDGSSWNYNQVWRREIQAEPEFKLIKNGFAISVNWSMYGVNLRRNNSLLLKKKTL